MMKEGPFNDGSLWPFFELFTLAAFREECVGNRDPDVIMRSLLIIVDCDYFKIGSRVIPPVTMHRFTEEAGSECMGDRLCFGPSLLRISQDPFLTSATVNNDYSNRCAGTATKTDLKV